MVDVSQDRNRVELHRIMNIVTYRPDFVKTARDAMVDADLDSIPSTSFADTENRLYPLHTKEATWCSACYMADAGVEGEPIKRLEKFARAWGIYTDVIKVITDVEQDKLNQKVAAEDFDYALDTEYNGGPVQRFPVNTPELVKLSVDRFYADRSNYPYSWRKTASENLHSKIRAFEIQDWIDPAKLEYIEKAAGLGVVSKSAMWNELAQREVRCRKHPALAKLAAVVEFMGEQDSIPVAAGPKICQAFASFDSDADVIDLVGLPEEHIIDATLSKVASERANYIQLQNGSTVDVRSMTPEKLAAAGLSGIDPEELQDVLPTIPVDQADVLVHL